MKQIKALLIKEWNTHRGALLLPTWFSLGVLGVMLAGFLWALVQGLDLSLFVHIKNIRSEFDKLVLWGMGVGGTTTLAFIAMIGGIVLGDGMLNGGAKRRCDIFHLSQPVSLARIIGTKFGLMTITLYLQVVVISLLGITATAPFVASVLHLPLSIAYTGVLQGLAAMFLPFLFVCCFFWMFSAIFRQGAFFKAILSVAGVELARNILNKIPGIHFPSLALYLNKLAGISVNNDPDITRHTLATLGGADGVINSFLGQAFDNYTWQRILFCVVFFAAGYWIYRRREVV